MARTIKAQPIDIYSKAKALLEQLKIGQQIEATKRAWGEKDYAAHPNGRDYESILKRVGLLDEQNLRLPFIPAQNTAPATFCFQLKRDELKKNFSFEANDTIFYTLIVGTNGKTILEVFRNNEKVDERYSYSDYTSFLNLPYLLGQLRAEQELKPVRKNLEKFLRANTTCTLANLYAFAKKNAKAVEKIPEELSAFKQSLEANGRARTEVYQHTTFIPNVFWVKIKNYGTKTKTIKYSLEEEATGPAARMDNHQNYYYPDYNLAKFPAKILIKEGVEVPLYLPASFFTNKAAKPSEESLCLLTFEEKLKDELAGYIATGKSEIKAAEANFRGELEEEFKSIGRALKKFLRKETSEAANSEQKEKMERLEHAEEALRKSTENLTLLLAQLYRKEVVLNNL